MLKVGCVMVNGGQIVCNVLKGVLVMSICSLVMYKCDQIGSGCGPIMLIGVRNMFYDNMTMLKS